MKKPALVVFNTQPPHLYFGGVERRIIETAKLLKNDFDIVICSGTKREFKQGVTLDGAIIVPFRSTDIAFPLDNWLFNQSISRASYRIEADVFEAHAVSGYRFLRTLRKKDRRTPFIQTIHGVLADEYLQASLSNLSVREKLANYFMRQLSESEKEAAQKADVVVTVSNYSLTRIVSLYDISEEKIRVVPNGVDAERFKPNEAGEAKAKYGLTDKQVVLFVGRLIPRKGLTYLLEAALKVIKENPQTIFMVVGNGPLRKFLNVELERLNISRHFMFMGDVRDEELPLIYSCADVFALPSIQEGQGIALLEAQASTKPVVAFDVSGVREAVVNGTSGLLVEKGNSWALAKVLLDLLSNPSLRQKMGFAGREFVLRNFTWEMCAEKMLKVYKQTLGL